MKARSIWIVLTVAAALLVSACGALLGLDPIERLEVSDADVEASADAADGGPGEAGLPSGEAGSVGEVGNAPCDAGELPPATGVVYVSAVTGSDDGGTGASATPYKTIGAALPIAKALDATTIVLDEGTYPERVDLASFPKGVRIDGAWKRTGALWERDCSANRRAKTLIQSPDDVGVTFTDLAVKSTLSNLTVTTRGPSPSGPDVDGTSRIGVIARGSIVALEGVTILAGAASAGGVATPGAPGATRCTTTTACEKGAAGAGGGKASPASAPGTFGPAGFTIASGQAGTLPGAAGQNGVEGGPANAEGDCQLDGQCAANGSSCNNVAGKAYSEPGRCGCGGQGGGPGAAGRGGGASVALLAVGGAVSVKFSELVAGNGGDGTAGGAGGAGGLGTDGANGQAGECWSVDCCVCGTCVNGTGCGCYKKGNWNACCGRPGPVNTPIPGGAAGGKGGNGGSGESGGAGAGGPSYAYVQIAGAAIVVEASKRAFGSGGKAVDGAAGGQTGEKP